MIESQIDWSDVWKSQMGTYIELNNGRDCVSWWDDKEEATNYWKMVKSEVDFIDNLIGGMKISPKFRVLDVGAGPGTLAIPFAKKVDHVTAVEPAKSMARVLEDNIKELEIPNIDCVQKRWEDIDVETDLKAPYDLVIASFSLGMIDIKAAIQKMMDASSKYVYLAWFAEEPSWDAHYRDLCTALYGTATYQTMPKSDVLFNVLYQMGIYPNVTVFPLEMFHQFPSFDDAVDYFSGHFQIATDLQESVLRTFLQQVLKENKGYQDLRYYSLNMLMWWDKTASYS